MPKILDKDLVFLEIRQSIKYLLREREQGKEKFEISDFFKRNLEDEILNNFNNIISREEYETAVLQLFGAKKKKKKKKKTFSRGRIQKEVEKLIRQYRMRSKRQILQKLVSQFEPDPDDIVELRDIVVEIYNKLMKEPLQRRISTLVRDGTTELRRVMSVLRREKYDIDRSEVKKILDKILVEQKKTISKYQRGARKPGFDIIEDADSPVKKRLRDQMRKSLVRKTRYRKQRFIRNECPKFIFDIVENKAANDMHSLIYSGKRGSAEIRVNTLLTNKRITEVLITCVKKGGKRGAEINIAEFQKAAAKGHGDAFLQQWLKKANKQLEFSNVQELIWFLMSVFNERFGLHEGVSDYLKTRIVQQLTNLDKSLTQYVVGKALESL